MELSMLWILLPSLIWFSAKKLTRQTKESNNQIETQSKTNYYEKGGQRSHLFLCAMSQIIPTFRFCVLSFWGCGGCGGCGVIWLYGCMVFRLNVTQTNEASWLYSGSGRWKNGLPCDALQFNRVLLNFSYFPRIFLLIFLLMRSLNN